MALAMIPKRKRDDTEGEDRETHPESKFLRTSDEKPTLDNRVYTCKTCGKDFLTFQALGGHRASHTNVNKAKTDLAVGFVMVKSHDCSVCGARFFSGQALGGHMRRHKKVKPDMVVLSDDSKSGCGSSELVNDTIVTWDFFAREPITRVKTLVETLEDLSGGDWLDLKLGF